MELNRRHRYFSALLSLAMCLLSLSASSQGANDITTQKQQYIEDKIEPQQFDESKWRNLTRDTDYREASTRTQRMRTKNGDVSDERYDRRIKNSEWREKQEDRYTRDDYESYEGGGYFSEQYDEDERGEGGFYSERGLSTEYDESGEEGFGTVPSGGGYGSGSGDTDGSGGSGYSERQSNSRQYYSNQDATYDNGGAFGNLLMIFMIIIIAVVVVFVLVKVLDRRPSRNKKKPAAQSLEDEVDEIERNIHESDLERALRLALEKKAYRLAIRIYYLAIIKELSLKSMISWARDKTNRDYLSELFEKPVYQPFKDATLTYERAWYGDVDITQDDYNRISPGFQSFINKLQGQQKSSG